MAASQSESWPFEVDYNDHFETPYIAYSDLLPFLNLLCDKIFLKTLKQLVVYDPYYCKGRMVLILSVNFLSQI